MASADEAGAHDGGGSALIVAVGLSEPLRDRRPASEQRDCRTGRAVEVVRAAKVAGRVVRTALSSELTALYPCRVSCSVVVAQSGRRGRGGYRLGATPATGWCVRTHDRSNSSRWQIVSADPGRFVVE